MDIFDLITANTNFLLSAAGALAMLLLGIYAPAAYKRKREAVAAYRLAFDDVLLNLRENANCPLSQITFACHPQHLAAINRFRSTVPVWSRRRFERDVTYYKNAHNIASEYGSVLAVALSENSDDAREKRKHYNEAIHRLLSHA